MCTHVCIYWKRFQRRKWCPYKFITAAKLTVFSVKDQLWGEKPHNTPVAKYCVKWFDCDSPGSLVFLLLLFCWSCFIYVCYSEIRLVGFCSERWFNVLCKMFSNFPKIFFNSGLFACDQDVRCHEVSSADVPWAKVCPNLPRQSNRPHPPPLCWMRYYLSMYLYLDWKTWNGCWAFNTKY